MAYIIEGVYTCRDCTQDALRAERERLYGYDGRDRPPVTLADIDGEPYHGSPEDCSDCGERR